jgi:hypothetical protein
MKEQALGQELTDDPAAARAEREPHRDLAPSSVRTDEQQVREVRRSQEQYGRDDGRYDVDHILRVKTRAVGSLRARPHS